MTLSDVAQKKPFIPARLRMTVRLPEKMRVLPNATHTLSVEQWVKEAEADAWPPYAVNLLRQLYAPEGGLLPSERVSVEGAGRYGYDWQPLGHIYQGVAHFADGRKMLLDSGEMCPPFTEQGNLITVKGQHDMEFFRRWAVVFAPGDICGYGPPWFNHLQYDAYQNQTTVRVFQHSSCD